MYLLAQAKLEALIPLESYGLVDAKNGAVCYVTPFHEWDTSQNVSGEKCQFQLSARERFDFTL